MVRQNTRDNGLQLAQDAVVGEAEGHSDPGDGKVLRQRLALLAGGGWPSGRAAIPARFVHPSFTTAETAFTHGSIRPRGIGDHDTQGKSG
jgi:hypothetical protein